MSSIMSLMYQRPLIFLSFTLYVAGIHWGSCASGSVPSIGEPETESIFSYTLTVAVLSPGRVRRLFTSILYMKLVTLKLE